MKLNKDLFNNPEPWEASGIRVPKFDFEKMVALTKDAPIWLHFGAGNIFRAFIAAAHQKLLEKGLCDRGITAAFTMEPDVIEELWTPCDNLSLSVTLNSDGTTDKEIIASVAECLYADKSSKDWERLIEVIKAPSLQIVSFTITEKGYNPDGDAMKKLRELLTLRKNENLPPVALLSMDNCAHNGDVLKAGVGGDFSGYSFPWSMIDKITPRPNDGVKADLIKLGFENAETVITKIGTYASAFVNAERTQYLVIEDDFPNGRPPLEKAGIIFSDKNTVDLCEKMKVGACLNPLHTCMAIFGSILRYDTIANTINDAAIKKMVERLGYDELLPVVKDPMILSPKDFIHECINERFCNPFLQDAPQRIATDTSLKLPVRFGSNILVYLEKYPHKLESLEIIPLVAAGWCRYLQAKDDDLNPMELSPDPLIKELAPNGLVDITKILSRADIFGADLYATPLGKKAEAYYARLSAGRGAVRKVLDSLI